jgi:hypothetical protein
MRIVRVWIILLGVGTGIVGCAGEPQLIPVTNPTSAWCLRVSPFCLRTEKTGSWILRRFANSKAPM